MIKLLQFALSYPYININAVKRASDRYTHSRPCPRWSGSGGFNWLVHNSIEVSFLR